MSTQEPRRSTGRSARALAAVAAAIVATACQKDDIAHYRVPKQEEPAAVPGPMAMPAGMPGGMPAGDVPAPPTPTDGSQLHWTLPAGWTDARTGGMRFATLKAPVDGRLDVSVVVLPGPAGGELSNVNRWRGQIGLPPLEEGALAGLRKPVRTKAGPVALYDFTSDGAQKSRVIAGLATLDGNTWFIKMTGDASAVERARPDFLRIVESLRLDAP